MRQEPHFGSVLRTLRVGAGLTQEEVAEHAGLSARAIGDLERGAVRRPQRRTVAVLVDALGLDEQDARLLSEAARRPVRPAGAAHPQGSAAEVETSLPRQLPREPQSFVARAAEMAELTRIGAGSGAGSGGGRVVTVVGAGGIGKTALALAWAHRNTAAFPDGQLFVDLRGFDPGGSPVPPHSAVVGFLSALGVPASRIPRELAEQTALYRTLVAGKRMLIVLDNASDSAQARVLLPGGRDCLTLVTSRDRLAGLVAADGAQPLCLAPFSDAEAFELLAGRLGRQRTVDQHEAVRELIAACAGLPLALAVVAARLAVEPDLNASDLASRLRDLRGRLTELAATDASTDLRTVFSWSHRRQPRLAAAVFVHLGLHPGPSVSADSVAVLAGAGLPETEEALRALADSHMVAALGGRRYPLHDLLRAYAAELAESDLESGEPAAARHRMLDHYTRHALAADLLTAPARRRLAVPGACEPADPPPFGTVDEAAA
jgi:transcriptional regulator with XRE-family HTH domain